MPTSDRFDSSRPSNDAQLADADGFLARSLSRDEHWRRVRRLWTMVGCIGLGGTVVMVSLIVFASNVLMASDKSKQGWQLWSQRRLPEAEAKFREAIMENNKDSDAWTGLGWSLTNTGRLEPALEAFQKANALDPANASAQNGIGQCALGLGKLDLAEETLKKAGEAAVKVIGGESKLSAQNMPAAWYGLVNVYLLKADYDEAKKWTDRIAKVNPDDPTLKEMQAQVDKRDNSAIKKMFDRGSTIKEDEVSSARAWQLWGSGAPDKAIPMFEQLIKQDPKDGNLQNGLGWCYLNTGKAEPARKAFLECLKLDPKHLAALNGVGQSSLALHDWDKAEEYLKKANESFLATFPEDKISSQNLPAAWYGLTTLYIVKGSYDEAKKWVDKILKYSPGDESAKEALAFVEKKDNSEVKKRLGVK